jgi:hypothetical protein
MKRVFIFKQGHPHFDQTVAAQVVECENGGYVASNNDRFDTQAKYHHFDTLEELEIHLLTLMRVSIRDALAPQAPADQARPDLLIK